MGAARRSLLRVLGVLALVSVVIFSNPLSAAASTSGVLSFTMAADLGEPAAKCSLPWARTAGGVSIGATARCDGGPDFSAFSCQPYEGDCGSFGLVFKDQGGATCGSAAFDPFDVAGNDVRSVATGLGAGFATISWTSCVPVQACLSYYWQHAAGFEPVDTVSCVPFGVTVPDDGDEWEPPSEMPFGSCLWGTPQAVAIDHKVVYSTNVKDKLKLLFYTRYPEPGDPPLSYEWRMNAIHGVKMTPANDNTAPPGGVETWTDSGYQNAQWQSTTLWTNDPEGLAGSHGPTDEVWGIQVTTRHAETSGSAISVGYTNPGKCTFWFGPKIRATDHPVYGQADPWGPITPFDEPPPPPDDDPPVVDVPTDPPNFGLPDIGSFLQGIGDAIKGMVRGILDGLKRLFIPSDGFFEQQIDRVKDAWADTAPGEILTTFANFGQGLTAPSSSGCEGPTLTINNVTLGDTNTDGGETELHPLSTCGPGVSQFAAIARVSLQLLVAVGAMVAGFRILAGAFGVNATPGASS